MHLVLIVVHVISCFAIIGIVLLQAGKGADIGSAFGGAGSQAVFGSMGTPTVLGKITAAIAAMFTITSFSLALLGGERGGSVVREAAPPPARLALILALGLAGCGGEADSAIDHAPASEKPAYGDTFIEALIGNISGLIPNVLSDSASFEVGSLLYSGLVTRDRDLNLIGELAESWRFSKDCLDLTLHLRRNVRWHDDAPFTAADVVFTYETMINPKTPTAYREDFRAVASVEAVDPYTLHVRYKQPYAKALQSWGVWMLPKHVLEPYVREGRLREAPQNRSNPVGTGAYRLKEWKPGEKVVLVANPDYFDGSPYIARIVYRIIPSQATIFLELKAKGVDSAGL